MKPIESATTAGSMAEDVHRRDLVAGRFSRSIRVLGCQTAFKDNVERRWFELDQVFEFATELLE